MNRLIFSMRSYDWINHTTGLILSEKENYSVMILLRDDDIPIKNYNLCHNAIYEQRRYDLFIAGKTLGIKKLMNLGYDPDNINIKKLTAQIQMYLFSGIKEIYAQYCNRDIMNMFNSICNMLNIKLYIYDIGNENDLLMLESKRIELVVEDYKIKCAIQDALHDNENIRTNIERFWKISNKLIGDK